MKNIENMFYNTDFSKNTDLKERLRARLFSSAPASKVTSFPFQQLDDADMDLINAAQGILPTDKDPDGKF